MPKMETKKALAEAVIHRVENSGVKGKLADKVARNMFLGASNLALIQGDRELAQDLHSSFTDIVEYGLKRVYTWAGRTMPVEAPETDDKEAA